MDAAVFVGSRVLDEFVLCVGECAKAEDVGRDVVREGEGGDVMETDGAFHGAAQDEGSGVRWKTTDGRFPDVCVVGGVGKTGNSATRIFEKFNLIRREVSAEFEDVAGLPAEIEVDAEFEGDGADDGEGCGKIPASDFEFSNACAMRGMGGLKDVIGSAREK